LDRVTPAERIARYRHSAATVSLGDREKLAWLLERKLFDRGCAVTIVTEGEDQTIAALQQAGLLVLLVSGRAPTLELDQDDAKAAQQIVAMLEDSGILLPDGLLRAGEGI
jgi:hypothetical protein